MQADGDVHGPGDDVSPTLKVTTRASPVNTVLARIVSDIAHMPQLWAKYRERPDALTAEVAAEVERAAQAAAQR